MVFIVHDLVVGVNFPFKPYTMDILTGIAFRGGSNGLFSGHRRLNVLT